MKTLTSGSYFRNDFLQGISGLGDDASLPFADQTLIGIIQAQPSLTYTGWALQNGDIEWTEEVPTQNYQAFAITDLQIVATAQAATSVPNRLAVISPSLSFASTVKKTFEGTPYAYQQTEAVYAQLDAAQPPAIYFIYWLTLRSATDPMIGNTSLNYAALQVVGVLSYIINVPQSGQQRSRPGVSFTQALAMRGGSNPGIAPPLTPAQQQTVPIVSTPNTSPPIMAPLPSTQASVASTSSDTAKAVLTVGIGVAAAVGAYKLWTSRSA